MTSCTTPTFSAKKTMEGKLNKLHHRATSAHTDAHYTSDVQKLFKKES